MTVRSGLATLALGMMTAAVMAPPIPARAATTARCATAPVIWANSPTSLVKFNVATGSSTTITTGLETFGDIAMAPNGTLYGVTESGDVRIINKADGTTTVAGTINASAVGGMALFRELAFDKYGKGYFLADGDNLLASFTPSPSGGSITPSVVVSDLRAAGFPAGNSAGDITFVGGNLYITWATSSGIRLMRLTMADTGSSYSASGAAGTAVDLGAIKTSKGYGLAAGGGRVFVTNGERIARLDHVPGASYPGMKLGVTIVKSPNVGVLQGLAAAGPATLDGCLNEPPVLSTETATVMIAGQDSRVKTAGEHSDTVTYLLTSGTLPPGTSLSPSNGNVFGIPTTPGTYRFYVTAVSTNGASSTGQFAITVHEANNSVDPTTTIVVTSTTAPAVTGIIEGSKLSRLFYVSAIVLVFGALLVALLSDRQRR